MPLLALAFDRMWRGTCVAAEQAKAGAMPHRLDPFGRFRSRGRLALGVLSVVWLAACGAAEEIVAEAGLGDPPSEALGAAPPEVADVEAVETNPVEAPVEPPRAAVAVTQAPAAAQLDTSNWVIAPPFYAAGDEPYWRLDIQDDWFVFRRAGLPEIEAPVVGPIKDGAVDIFESPPLSIHVSRQACTTADGERGRVTASVWFDDVSFDGCAFEGQSAGSSAEVTAVADSIRAVDSCLAQLGDLALVTGIYMRGDRQTALGLRTRDGRLFECVTEGGGAIVAFLDPVEPGAAGPWMTSGMRFLRAGQGVDACDEAEAVSEAGSVLGHMLTSGCRF